MNVVLKYTYVSILVQFITLLIGLQAILIKVKKEHQIVQDVLKIEMIVQIIELFFYLVIVWRFSLEDMAATRYFDWFITTPTMLFTTMAYFNYETLKERGGGSTTLTEFWNAYKPWVLLVFAANFGMLLFGYAAEIGMIPRWPACILGFACFLVSFSMIYARFAKQSKVGRTMFTFLAAIWGMYGIAFMFPTVEKNLMYNALDIVAKNFFGVYLFFIVNQHRSSKESSA